MCIIAVKPKNMPMISDETIKEMYRRNSDGAGIMFVTPNKKVHIEKGFFNVDKFIDYIHAQEDWLKKTDVVLHFRIGTSGLKDEYNCHPFSVWTKNKTSDNVELGLAHNGILDSYGFVGNDKISDTQVFIKYLRNLPHNFLRNKTTIDLIKSKIGTNKLAFLSNEGYTLIGDFIEDNGCYYSNTTYKGYRYITPKSYWTPDLKPVSPAIYTPKQDLQKIYRDLLDVIWRNYTGEIKLSDIEFTQVMSYIEESCRKLDSDNYYNDDYLYTIEKKEHNNNVISRRYFEDDYWGYDEFSTHYVSVSDSDPQNDNEYFKSRTAAIQYTMDVNNDRVFEIEWDGYYWQEYEIWNKEDGDLFC